MPPPLTLRAWLRWDVVQRRLPPLDRSTVVLELGAGQGAVAARLAERARYIGVEPDPASRAVATGRLPTHARMLADVDEVDTPADVLCSFEVLEHLDDDVGTLRRWLEHLRPGGTVVVSVPAWPERFGPWDRAAGHVRRYDVPDLVETLEGAGLVDVVVEAYGFPLASVVDRLRDVLITRRPPPGETNEERTAASGRLFQPGPWLGSVLPVLVFPFRLLQRPFRNRRLGTGLIGVGRLPAAPGASPGA